METKISAFGFQGGFLGATDKFLQCCASEMVMNTLEAEGLGTSCEMDLPAVPVLSEREPINGLRAECWCAMYCCLRPDFSF